MRISSIHECNLVRLICKLDFSHILTRNNTFTLPFHLCLTERKKFDLNFSRLWYLIWSQKILSQKWRAKVTNLIMTTFFSLVSKIFKKSRRLYCFHRERPNSIDFHLQLNRGSTLTSLPEANTAIQILEFPWLNRPWTACQYRTHNIPYDIIA